MDTEIVKDPSGTYTINYIGDGQMSMTLASYQQLMKDPYTGFSASVSQVVGNAAVGYTVILNPGDTSGNLKDGYPTSDSGNWAGAAAGDCTFSVASNGGLQCGRTAYTQETSGVYGPSTMTWDGSCWTGSSCATGFWTGLSGSNDVSGDLLQNGINVCYNHAGCNGGGSYTGHGTMTWVLFYADLHGSNKTEKDLSTYPTSINSTQEEFVFSFTETSQSPTFQWSFGSTDYYLTVSLANGGSSQSTFVQTEGVFEALGTSSPVIVVWSPSAPSLTGWGESPHTSAGDVSIGSSYNVGLLYLYKGSSLEAYGEITGSTSFTVVG